MTPDFRDRMRQALGQPADGHLTADVLNAYAEQALTTTEAQRVLQHLSVCAECREIVYLASAAREEPAPAATIAPARKKIRWWTWAVPVAAMAVVASTFLLVKSERAPNAYIAQSAKQEAAPPAAPPPPANETKAEQPAPAVKPERSQSATAVAALKPAPANEAREKDKAAKPAAEVSPDLDTMTRLAKNAPTVPQPAPMQRRDAFNDRSAVPAPASSADAVREMTSVNVTAQSQQVEIPQSNSVNDATFHAKSAVALQSNLAVAGAASKQTLALPAWRVTSMGTLEHHVGVQWKPVLMSPNAQILAVTSVGENVWAAAKNLALYHSGDDGEHWERQTLPQEAHGDIVQLTFSSELDGTVQTSTGELWATHDGGKTWAKQTPAR